MNVGIVQYLRPEERDLARKREELASLQAELTERELFLASLRAELAAFEGRYLREVGVLYAELDDWNARIAELVAEEDGSAEAKSAAAKARVQAEESYAAAHGEAAKAAEFSPTPELKALFREVVRQIHPDNAADEADCLLRNRLMAEANLAYKRGDEDTLRRILEKYKRSPESVKGKGIPADLQRIQLQIDQIIRRLAQIESEIAQLISSDLAFLMAKVENAAALGRDLLAEMAKNVANRIQLAQTEFETQSSKQRAP